MKKGCGPHKSRSWYFGVKPSTGIDSAASKTPSLVPYMTYVFKITNFIIFGVVCQVKMGYAHWAWSIFKPPPFDFEVKLFLVFNKSLS